MSDEDIYRVKLMRWGDSSAAGRTVTLKLPDDTNEHPFKNMPIGAKNGQLMEISVRLLNEDGSPVTVQQKPPKKENPVLKPAEEPTVKPTVKSAEKPSTSASATTPAAKLAILDGITLAPPMSLPR